jgi:hypothetical protein
MKLLAEDEARFFVFALDAKAPSRNPLPARPCSVTSEYALAGTAEGESSWSVRPLLCVATTAFTRKT